MGLKFKAGDIDALIGKNLKNLRVQEGLSQTKLAELLGVSFQQVQKYELGSNRVSAAMLHHLSAIFNVSMDTFFEDSPALNESPNKSSLSPNETKEFLELLEKITNKAARRQVKVILETLSS